MEELLTVDEMAKLLKVSPWTIYGWCSQKYIPHLKLKNLVRFRAGDIEKWLKQNHQPGRSLHRLRIEAGINRSLEPG